MNPGWDAALDSWPTLEAFYAADPSQVRVHSGESDFGVWWWDGRQGYSDQWRVSSVENTGEIYAVMMRGNLRESRTRVVLLGSLGPDPGYTKSHACLLGWEEVCGAGDSLEWAVNRVRLATGTVAAVEAPLVDEAEDPWRRVGRLASELLLALQPWQSLGREIASAASELTLALAVAPETAETFLPEPGQTRCYECGWDASFSPPEIETCPRCSGPLLYRRDGKA